jgi:hypothetical protein
MHTVKINEVTITFWAHWNTSSGEFDNDKFELWPLWEVKSDQLLTPPVPSKDTIVNIDGNLFSVENVEINYGASDIRARVDLELIEEGVEFF